jgi:hypothetical protein
MSDHPSLHYHVLLVNGTRVVAVTWSIGMSVWRLISCCTVVFPAHPTYLIFEGRPFSYQLHVISCLIWGLGEGFCLYLTPYKFLQRDNKHVSLYSFVAVLLPEWYVYKFLLNLKLAGYSLMWKSEVWDCLPLPNLTKAWSYKDPALRSRFNHSV